MTRGRALVVLGLLAGCGGADAPPRPAERPALAAAADRLGREGFVLLDRAVEYRGAGVGRAPASLRELGVDSLTPTTSRRLLLRGSSPAIVVALRHPEPGGLAECLVPEPVLEDAALGGGRFRVACTLTDGTVDTFTVGDDR